MSEHDESMNQTDELLELYVLDLLDEEETSRVEDWLSRDPEARERVREIQGVTAMLGLELEPMEPSTDLRSLVMESARAEQPPAEPASIADRQDKPAERRSRGWLPWAAAAVLALALVASVIWNIQLQGQLDDRLEVAQYPVAAVENDGASGEVLVLPERDAAVLTLANVGQLEPGSVYQVWLITEGSPESAGTFLPSQDGIASVVIRGEVASSQTIAITVEPEGGSEQPTTEPIIAGELAMLIRWGNA